MASPRSRIAAVLIGALALSAAVAGPADARRGGSFGSRGARTYAAPPPTATSPGYTRPVERSMTAPPAGQAAASRPNVGAAPAARPAQPPRRFGGLGLGGGLLAGLVTGGLIGALLGHGWGGLGGLGAMGGLFSALLQVAVIALLAMLAFRLFRRRTPAAAAAGAGAPGGYGAAYQAQPAYTPRTQPDPQWTGGGGAPAHDEGVEIGVTMDDRNTFERMLSQVQDAFSREDYGALRELTTPEIMSYLAEELSQNATRGQRNDVTATRLLQADIAEAWREGDTDYATAAFRYESIDVMRDRQSGQVVSGDPNTPTPAVEHWTFVRRPGAPWKLSAIQES